MTQCSVCGSKGSTLTSTLPGCAGPCNHPSTRTACACACAWWFPQNLSHTKGHKPPAAIPSDLQVPHVVWFFLCEEKSPIKRYLDTNEKELVSVKILGLKWKARALWNPKYRRAKHHANIKLPATVTHDHVLHAPDNEEDLRHVMRCLNLSSPEHYLPKTLHGIQGVPWHVNFSSVSRHKRMALGTVKTYLHGTRGGFRLEETPHVAYARGTREPYLTYWASNAGRGLVDDHSPSKFDRLLAVFNVSMARDGPALALVNRKGYVQDGLHRLAILWARGVREADVWVMRH